MKKLLFVVVLVMSVAVVNAQVTPSSNPSSADSSYSRSPGASSARTIPAADLPQAVTDNIKKDYPGYTIKNASSVTGKDGLNYQVDVMKGSANETLLFDSKGKFLRKLTPKSSDMHKDM